MSAAAPAGNNLEHALRGIGEDVSSATSAYAIDGVAPALAATPQSVEQLCAALAAANDAGAAVVPWGAGTQLSLGNVLQRYDLALRTTALDRVLEYEPADLTISVEAGITFGTLRATLAGHGQFLPIDAPPEATVGGALATGLSGPSAHMYGVPRDWLIGCRVALAGGALIKGGGRVVKNVAGYDLPKVFVGSLGSLGVIVEATFKVAPLPPAEETLVISIARVEAAASLAFAAARRGLALRSIALAGGMAAFRIAGTPAAVERTRRELRDLSPGATSTVHDAAQTRDWWSQLEASARGDVTLHLSLLPADVPRLAQRLADSGARWLAYPTTGIALASLATDVDDTSHVIQALRRSATERGGSLIVTRAPVEVKGRIDVWGDGGSALPLMRRLKHQFDPKGTLNPGRFVGGL